MTNNKRSFASDVFESMESEAPATSFISQETIETNKRAEAMATIREAKKEKTEYKNGIKEYSRSGQEKRTAKILVSLTPSFYELLKDRAKKDGRSVGSLLTKLAEEYLERASAVDAVLVERKQGVVEAETEAIIEAQKRKKTVRKVNPKRGKRAELPGQTELIFEQEATAGEQPQELALVPETEQG